MNKLTHATSHFLKNLVVLFIFILIPIILFVLITSHTSAIFGIRSFDVLTGSMEPKIHTGSMVFSKTVLSYQIGDVITFKRGDITVTHRIVGIKNNQFVTKGDANKAQDPQLVSKFNVIGRVFITIPNVGKLIGFIKTIPGFIIFIGLPTFIFIGFEAKTIMQEWKKEIEKRLLGKLKEVGET
jgi:signal peptidase I